MLIEILNWSKYNPRNDVKHTTWFRMENTFWSDPAITPLDSDGKVVWVMLLSLASQRQEGTLEVDIAFISAVTRIPIEKIHETLDHFQRAEKIKIPTLRRRHVRVTQTLRPRDATDVRTYGRDGTDETDETDETNATVKSDPVDPTELALGREWLDFAMGEMPWAKNRAWTEEAFTEAIGKLKRASNLSSGQVGQVLAFIKTDDFWKKNAVSPTGLLKKSQRNGNRKIDNILLRMKPPETKTDKVARALMAWASEDDGGGNGNQG